MRKHISCLTAGFVIVVSLHVPDLYAQDPNLKPNYGTVSLKANFLPDPFVKPVTAGGPTRTTFNGVTGHITKQPDFRLFYEAGGFQLTIRAESAADTILLINLPDGTWVSNDNGPNTGQNPMIRFPRPASGRYDIWVGTINNQNAQANLIITERGGAAVVPVKPKPPTGPTVQEVIAWQNEADKLRANGQYEAALPIYKKMLAETPRLWGEGSPTHAIVYHKIGVNYNHMRQFANGEAALLQAVRIRETKLGDDKNTADSLHMLGFLYVDWNKYDKAETFYLRSLGMRERVLGKNHIDVSDSLNNLGIVYYNKGEHIKARDSRLRCLQIREGQVNRDELLIASALYNLGSTYVDLNEYSKAEELQMRAYDIYVARLGKNHVLLADSCNNLGILNRDLGRYVQAEQFHLRALKIRESALGRDHLAVAQTLNNLAIVYIDMRQDEKAEAALLRGLPIREKQLGPNDTLVADIVNSLGTISLYRRDYDKAEQFYERSLRIYQTNLGKKHERVALPLDNLGSIYQVRKDYVKAESYILRALEIRETVFGKDHRTVANTLNNLGGLYEAQREHVKSAPLYLRALGIWEAKLGRDHPTMPYFLNNLAVVYALQKDWDRAVPQCRLGRQAATQYMARYLPALSEQEQLNVIGGSHEKQYHQALSMGWSAPGPVGAASAEWLLNGKAIAHQSLAEQQLLARDAKSPAARALVTELQQIRARLATHINTPVRPGNEAQHQQEMRNLTTLEQDFAQKLARTVGRSYRPNPWLALDELRAKLGPKTAYVDIARFALYDFNNDRPMGNRYVAWITPPAGKGDVKVVDLGDADAIEKLVAQARKNLIESVQSIKKVGEIDAVAALQKQMNDLAAKVLHPLLPTIEKYEEWIICPDGALWLTPWQALPLPKGEFAVEKFLIRHVVSGRDLVQELPKVQTKSAYIFADPDYDLNPTKVIEESGGLRGIGAGGLGGVLGQRLRGTIGTWNVSFEFLDNEVVIRDEDSKGAIVGKGTWKLQGGTLTVQTKISTFTATSDGNSYRGERTVRNDDGSLARDGFRIDRPRGEGDGEPVRNIGAAHGVIPRVKRLPGTALEAEAIRPKLQAWLGQEPQVFLEGKASESLVKVVINPRVLTLATHGYFLPKQEVKTNDNIVLSPGESGPADSLRDDKDQPLENPLLRCGLLLAGCNKRSEAKPGENDGILTGLEIVGMNLNGCELVVLSACDTGLGDVRGGEGVAGLRQAFQLAGAKGVLASLWQIPDTETALLASAFYGELAKGSSQAQALRNAQLQRLTARRNQFGAAHPFFWSAFTLTSRGTE